MSGHYVPIKPITALPNLDSFTTRTCSTESTFYQTPLTIHERTLLLQPPYQLTCSIDELLKPARRKRFTPPRSLNPWIIFRKDFLSRIRAKNPGTPYSLTEISAAASNQWQTLPDAVKQYFKALAKIAREQHKITYPGYIYRPKRIKQHTYNLFENGNPNDEECDEMLYENNYTSGDDSSTVGEEKIGQPDNTADEHHYDGDQMAIDKDLHVDDYGVYDNTCHNVLCENESDNFVNNNAAVTSIIQLMQAHCSAHDNYHTQIFWTWSFCSRQGK